MRTPWRGVSGTNQPIRQAMQRYRESAFCALPVFSLELGLSGQADIVELRGKVPYPVEYKRGKRRAWDNDECAVVRAGLVSGGDVPTGGSFGCGLSRCLAAQARGAIHPRTTESNARGCGCRAHAAGRAQSAEGRPDTAMRWLFAPARLSAGTR